MAQAVCKPDTGRDLRCTEMLLGLSLCALIELFGIPAKYLSFESFQMVLFDCGKQYLVCTCSGETCVQARYSTTCVL